MKWGICVQVKIEKWKAAIEAQEQVDQAQLYVPVMHSSHCSATESRDTRAESSFQMIVQQNLGRDARRGRFSLAQRPPGACSFPEPALAILVSRNPQGERSAGERRHEHAEHADFASLESLWKLRSPSDSDSDSDSISMQELDSIQGHRHLKSSPPCDTSLPVTNRESAIGRGRSIVMDRLRHEMRDGSAGR